LESQRSDSKHGSISKSATATKEKNGSTTYSHGAKRKRSNKKINEEQGNRIHGSIDDGSVAVGRCNRGYTHLPIFGKNLQKY
jgi:hypothetical protein